MSGHTRWRTTKMRMAHWLADPKNRAEVSVHRLQMMFIVELYRVFEASGLTEAQLADKMEVSIDWVHVVLNNETEFDLDTTVRFLSYLGSEFKISTQPYPVDDDEDNEDQGIDDNATD